MNREEIQYDEVIDAFLSDDLNQVEHLIKEKGLDPASVRASLIPHLYSARTLVYLVHRFLSFMTNLSLPTKSLIGAGLLPILIFIRQIDVDKMVLLIIFLPYILFSVASWVAEPVYLTLLYQNTKFRVFFKSYEKKTVTLVRVIAPLLVISLLHLLFFKAASSIFFLMLEVFVLVAFNRIISAVAKSEKVTMFIITILLGILGLLGFLLMLLTELNHITTNCLNWSTCLSIFESNRIQYGRSPSGIPFLVLFAVCLPLFFILASYFARRNLERASF